MAEKDIVSILMREMLSLNHNLKQKVQEQDIILSARWDELATSSNII